MKTRTTTKVFAALSVALLWGTVAAFGAEPRVWTNSLGAVALRGTLNVERTLDATPGVEAPTRVYFVDVNGDLYSFRYRHLSEEDRAIVDAALDEPAPPKKIGRARLNASPLGTPLAPSFAPPRRLRVEAKPVAPPTDVPVSSSRPATVRVKIKLVDATGAPIPRAWFQGKILGGAATTSLRAHSDSDGGFTIALAPGVEYEALVTEPRGGTAVFYERAKFRAPEANFDAVSLTLNVGGGKELKLTDRAAQEISNEFRPADEEELEIAPLDGPSNADATARNGKTAAFETETAMKLKFVDASGAPIPKITAQVQRKKRPSPTHWWRSESGEGFYTIDLAPGEYEARATARRGNETVIYEGTTFTVCQGNGESVELTLNVGKTKNSDDALEPTESALSDAKTESTATLLPVKPRAITTLKVVDAAGKPVPFAEVEATQVVQKVGLAADFVELRADGAGVVSTELLRGVEYGATVWTDVTERALKEGESELFARVKLCVGEGLRFTVPNDENAVVELKLNDSTKGADDPKTAKPAEEGQEAVFELKSAEEAKRAAELKSAENEASDAETSDADEETAPSN